MIFASSFLGRSMLLFPRSSCRVSLAYYCYWAATTCSSSSAFANTGSRNTALFHTRTSHRSSSSSAVDIETTTTTATSPQTMSAQAKVDALRNRMQELNLDVYLVPTDDPHLSEYVPEAYKRRAFLTGFSGSAGTAVVTHDAALLWTDSRYWNEASLQLDDTVWTLQKAGAPSTPTISKWLQSTAKEQYEKSNVQVRIGLDPFVHAASFAKEVKDLFDETTKEEGWGESPGTLVTEHGNLIDPIWKDRPALPVSPFRVHPIEYAGTTVSEKLAAIRKEMEVKKATALVLCSLDDIAYTFNVRAKGDIDTCPVGISYGFITQNDAFLYCDEGKIVDVVDHLREGGVTPLPYDQIIEDMKAHCANADHAKVWIDKARANLALASALDPSQIVDAQNPVTPMKAVKNEAELAGMREAHIVDGVAMAKFMAWLEKEVSGGRSVSEVEIDEVLTAFRAEQEGFVECSFPTIAGVGANGAIIHYRAQADSGIMKSLDKTAPILIDSGGQYQYGTTDVTRTWSFQDSPDPEFMEYYTRVLKGHIGLDVMVFPMKTPGFVLDVYARRWLWEIGSDYGHGTGHVSCSWISVHQKANKLHIAQQGVGAALNVHEGPQSISPRWKNTEGLKPGMVLSNEPGYYDDGNFGVRIENLLEIDYVHPSDKDREDDPKKKKFLKFKRLTMIPIQKNLIKIDLMSDEEIEWLNSYHAEVMEKVGSRLDKSSDAYAWLERACEKIEK